jgi:hypothetical protein
MEHKQAILNSPSNAEQTLAELLQAVQVYERHLLQFPDTRIPLAQQQIDRKRAVQIWCRNAKSWNKAPTGLNITDVLFIVLCYDHIATQKCPRDLIPDDTSPIPDLNELYERVFQIGLVNNSSSCTEEELEKQFTKCAIEVIYHLSPEIDKVQERMAMTFDLEGYSKGNEQLVVDDGKQTKEERRQEELDKKELAQEAKARELQKRTKNFLPLCSRVFLGRWAELAIADRWDTEDGDGAVIPEEKQVAAFQKWIDEQLPFDPNIQFCERQRNWLMRDHCLIDAALFASRNLGSDSRIFKDDELLREDQSSDLVEKLVKQSDEKEAKLKQHGEDPYVQLAMFTSIFDGAFRLADTLKNDQEKKTIAEMDGGFCAWFVVFRGQLLQRLTLLEESMSFPMVPRRPIIVQICKGWRVHDGKKWHMADSVSKALLIWMHLIKTKFQGKLATGQSLEQKKWLELFGV